MPQTAADLLKGFFERSTVALKATAPLSEGVAVNIEFTDDSPVCHFLKRPGGGTVLPGKHPDPDFSLVMPPESAAKLTSVVSDDPGDFGVEFFKLCVSKDPAEKIRVQLHAGLFRILSHGYIGVVGVGGRKMLGWMKEKGVFGVSGFKTAVTRLRERSKK